MSVSDVDKKQNSNIQKISHEELSGIDLSVAPAIQFHQKIRSDTGQHRYTNQLNFQSPALNQDNRIYFPAMPIMPEELTIQFKMARANWTGGESTDPLSFIPTFAWVGNNGLRLLYKNTVIYNCSQAELQCDFYLNSSPSDLWRKQYLVNDLTSPLEDANTATRYYYLRLDPLMKIFKHIGSLDSYDANAWSIEIDLKQASQIVYRVSGTTDTNAGTTSIETMSLLVSGHQSSPEFARSIRNKLNSSGLQINFLQSNYQRDSLGSADTSLSVSLNQLEGNVSGMYIINRFQAYVNGATINALAPSGEYVALLNYDDLLRVGVSSNPTLVFGRDLPILSVMMGVNTSKQFTGSSVFVNVDGGSEELSIIPISFADLHSSDDRNGSATGSYYVKNDLQFAYTLGTAVGADAYVDSIVFIHRYALIRSDGVVTNNL